MSEHRHLMRGRLSLAFTLGLCLLLLLPGAVPRLADAQGPTVIQSFTLREFGAFVRDGDWALYSYPGSPFPLNPLGGSFNVAQVCEPSGSGGVFLSAGQGTGDFAAFTPGWPFPPGPLCDPDADNTAWLAYGNSLNLLSPGQSPPRYSGTDFVLQPPSCGTQPTAVEGVFFVGVRARARQTSDLACQNRDPSRPIRVGNVLICSLFGTWLTSSGALNPQVNTLGFRSCEFYATCSDQPVGPDAPRGFCGNTTGAPLNLGPLVGVTGIGGGSGIGSVTVLVNNAATGNPIPSATVTQGGGATQTTGAAGTTTFANVVAGLPVLFTASTPGFVTAQTTTTPTANGSVQITISLTTPVSGGRIILNWGGDPRDLDSHLTGPDGGGGRFHVYYANRSEGGAFLDRDDVDGNGPETITVSQIFPGTYRYSVHHYAGNQSICATRNQITVSVFVGSTAGQTFRPPASGCIAGVNDVWIVFEFDGVSVIPINAFYSSSSGGVRGLDSDGFTEEAALFRALPAK